ncbi:MAG: hypothetical protein NWP80_00385 [Candidatus Gracilibacteria bacterium]|nr:hypothetical protein [Candidatus Gracilibacteria bacterium]
MEINIIKNLVSDFLIKIEINNDFLEVTQEEENVFFIKIKTLDSSIFIGYLGKNLEDIRNILKILITKKLGKNIIIHLEVNDYLSKKDDKIYNFISKKIEYLEKTGNEIILPFYNPYERKKIHSFVNSLKNENIFTKSVGEGDNRRIHLIKKSKNITIDLDGIDI